MIHFVNFFKATNFGRLKDKNSKPHTNLCQPYVVILVWAHHTGLLALPKPSKLPKNASVSSIQAPVCLKKQKYIDYIYNQHTIFFKSLLFFKKKDSVPSNSTFFFSSKRHGWPSAPNGVIRRTSEAIHLEIFQVIVVGSWGWWMWVEVEVFVVLLSISIIIVIIIVMVIIMVIIVVIIIAIIIVTSLLKQNIVQAFQPYFPQSLCFFLLQHVFGCGLFILCSTDLCNLPALGLSLFSGFLQKLMFLFWASRCFLPDAPAPPGRRQRTWALL